MHESQAVLAVRDLRKVFRASGRAGEVTAVDGVSLSVERGQSLAVVGESGSGKTTVARILVGLERPTSGEVAVCGRSRAHHRVSPSERRRRARELQIVFQDPSRSLDPRQTIGKCIEEVVRQHFGLDAKAARTRSAELLDRVGLQRHHLAARPRELSGGQQQRCAIARALAAEPTAIILDEAVAALDVSVQAQVLNLLADIRESSAISYLFISHDLAVVRQVSDEVVVMHKGRVVERGETEKVLDDPAEEYTRRLRAAVPGVGWNPERQA